AVSRRGTRADAAGTDLEQPQPAGRADDRCRQRLPDRGDGTDPRRRRLSAPPTRATAGGGLGGRAKRSHPACAQPPATSTWRGARLIGSQLVSVTIAVSPSDIERPVSLLSRIMCRKNTMFGANTCGSPA